MTVENISIDVKTNADRAATKINALSLALERLEGTARTTQGAAQSVSSAMNSVAPAGANAANGAKSAARGIDDVAKSAKKAQSPMGNFISSLKRIAFYRMLRTIIKEISQAIKEGMDNLYEFSKANNDFGGIASSFDGLASAAQTMKNQLGATFGQILAAAAPILIQLMQLVTQLTQVFYPLAQAIAAIEPVISAVVSVVTDLINVIISLFDLLGLNVGKIVADDATKSWKDAKKAAGDYKNTILGFDEINRLNSPGGGGGGGDTGAFSRYEVSDGDKSPFKFEWVATFKDKIDDAIGKIKDLVAELALIPDWVLIDILVKDGATQPLEGLVQTAQLFPLYATVIMAVQGNPVPLIQTVRVAIVNFVRESVGSFSELQTAYAGACATVEADSYSLAGSFEEIFASITETVNAWVNNYASCVDGVMVENATLGQDVTDTYNRLKNPLNGWVSHVWQKIEEYQEALGEVYVENATLSENMATTYAKIKSNVVGAFNNIKSNISIFVSETLPKWGEWANGIAETAFKAFASIASSAYDGLSNAGENLINWLSSTSSNIASWASGTLATIGEWAQGIAKNVASALKSAWESFKSFKKATGEAIDAFYEEHSFAANLIFGTRNEFSVSTGIPLIPAWGASGAFVPIFADGGVHDLSMGSLFVAGEAGAEIVTNMGSGKTGVTNVEQMKEAVREGNFELLNVVQGGINIIVKAINEIDPDITLDGQSLADSMYHYNKQAANRYGAAMVT